MRTLAQAREFRKACLARLQLTAQASETPTKPLLPTVHTPTLSEVLRSLLSVLALAFVRMKW